MLEARNKNIERNNKFLESLGIIANTTVALSKNNEQIRNNKNPKQNVSSNKTSRISKEQLYEKYLFREKEIDFIYQFVEMVSTSI